LATNYENHAQTKFNLNGEEMRREPIIYDRLAQSILRERKVTPLSTEEIRDGVNCTVAFGYLMNKPLHRPKNPEFFRHEWRDYVECYFIAMALRHNKKLTDSIQHSSPWIWSMSRPGYGMVGEDIPSSFDPTGRARLVLHRNGVPAADSVLCDMLHSPGDIMQYCANHFTLNTGDVILTGPAGPCKNSLIGHDFVTDGDNVVCQLIGEDGEVISKVQTQIKEIK
jgi:2-keto-4-pentenoate hydratase/2-oxohepta-3-ene-1,7-dioic acid hydratase in catechol pathway